MPLMPVILVAEDEPLIRALLQDALTEAGYELVISDDGGAALGELERDAGRFSGVITDVRLGQGPDGWEVGHRARERSANIPVIYITGDSAADWTSNGVPNSLLVNKPFAVAQIVTAISALLVEESTRRSA